MSGERRRCPVCDAEAESPPVVHRRERDVLLRCPHCRSLFAWPRPSPDALRELYAREYYDTGAGEAPLRRAEQERSAVLHQTVLRALRRRYPGIVHPGRRVLDFGCGLGHFLSAATGVGLVACGVEFSPEAAAHARDVFGLDVRTGDEAALADLPDGAFDLVTCWEVIEHAVRPRETLGLLAAKLAAGGVLGISTPNLRCWRYRLQGGRWFNVANPTHLSFLTLPALKDLLAALGLVSIRRVVFWGGRPGFGPLRNLLQYVARVADLGSDIRVFAQRPAGTGVSTPKVS